MKPRSTTLLNALIACALGAALGTAACGPTTAPAAFRVMTFNIHYGDPDLAGIASVICGSGADVVGLQEVDVHWSERSAFADQATELAAACGMEVRFGPIYELPPARDGDRPRAFGVAVLSRLPLLAARNHDLVRLSTQTEGRDPTPMPGFLQVTIDVDGTPVDVFTTHLDYRPDPAVRRAQVGEMLSTMPVGTGPVVLLGDLNAPPDREELGPLLTRMRDAWSAGSAGSGPGFTFPSDDPARRIDYVLVAGPLEVTSARVLETTASDHRPVVVDLRLTAR